MISSMTGQIAFFCSILMRCRSALPAALLVVVLGGVAAHADIYGLKSRSLSGSSPDQYGTPVILFRFADGDSAPSFVRYVRTAGGQNIRADGLAWSRIGGMYVFEPSGPGDAVQTILRPLDPATAIVGEGVTLTGRHIFGASCDALDNLWALDQQQDELIRIDRFSGQVLEEVALSLDGQAFSLDAGSGDIAFDAGDRAWIVSGDTFYQVDTSTGVMTLQRTYTGISLWMVGAAFSSIDPTQLLRLRRVHRMVQRRSAAVRRGQ